MVMVWIRCRWRIARPSAICLAGIWRNLWFLPIDAITTEYMRLSGRIGDDLGRAVVENAYAKARECETSETNRYFTSTLELDGACRGQLWPGRNARRIAWR